MAKPAYEVIRRDGILADGQTELEVDVFQGEHSLCSRNQKLGSYLLKGLAPERAGSQGVDVRFTCDLNGILEVGMTLVSTGRKESFVVEQRPGTLTVAEIALAREAMQRLKLHPRDSLPNLTALARAEALSNAISIFRGTLDLQSPGDISVARGELTELTRMLRG